jgi:hypothetical protein
MITRWHFLTGIPYLLAQLLLTPAAHAGIGQPEWGLAFEPSGSVQSAPTLAVDAAGNSFVAGTITGSMDMAPNHGGVYIIGPSSYHPVSFVQKLDTNGNLVWGRAIGGLEACPEYMESYEWENCAINEGYEDWGATSAEAIAVDSFGNVYVTGQVAGTVDFDPGPAKELITIPTFSDYFLLKLNADGEFAWVRTAGGGNYDAGVNVLVAPDDSVYTAAAFDQQYPSGIAVEYAPRYTGIAVFKYDTDGNTLWSYAVDESGLGVGNGLALDNQGALFVGGWASSNVDFDPGLGELYMDASAGSHGFVLKLGPQGEAIWVRSAVSSGSVRRLAVDSARNIYTIGYFSGVTDFDPGPSAAMLSSTVLDDGTPSYGLFVQKLTSDGDFLWVRAMEGKGDSFGDAISLGSDDDIYIAGRFTGSMDLDPGLGVWERTAGQYVAHAVLARLNPDGGMVWGATFGNSYYTTVSSIQNDEFGNVYVPIRFGEVLEISAAPAAITLVSNTGPYEYSYGLVKFAPNDTTPPNVVSITAEPSGSTKGPDLSFLIAFDDLVTQFDDLTDVIITHSGTSHESVSLTGSGATYTVTLSGIVGNGSISLAVDPANDIEDEAGNPLAETGTSALVTVDQVPPVVELLGANPLFWTCGESNEDPGATVVDETDENVVVVVDASALEGASSGDYQITYTATDQAGNVTQITRDITLQDLEDPVLALTGGQVDLSCNEPYVDPGYTAFDTCAGDLRGAVVVSYTALDTATPVDAIDTRVPGSYQVTYEVEDGAGRTADMLTRLVTVNADCAYTRTLCTAALDGAQQVPANDTSATGVASWMQIGAGKYLLRIEHTVADATFAELRAGAPGASGAVVLDLGNPASPILVEVEASLYTAMARTPHYLSIGAAESGAAIRGDLTCDPFAGADGVQTVDKDGDFIVSLSELLRVIQLYNVAGLHCAEEPGDTEDGYVSGTGLNHDCAPHDSDYNPQDWVISLTELLRAIQLYNAAGYHYCPIDNTEDDFCPGLG